jgi:hypothetical protein
MYCSRSAPSTGQHKLHIFSLRADAARHFEKVGDAFSGMIQLTWPTIVRSAGMPNRSRNRWPAPAVNHTRQIDAVVNHLVTIARQQIHRRHALIAKLLTQITFVNGQPISRAAAPSRSARAGRHNRRAVNDDREEDLFHAGKFRNPWIERKKADEMKMQGVRSMLLQDPE